jgi:hypothetical protein
VFIRNTGHYGPIDNGNAGLHWIVRLIRTSIRYLPYPYRVLDVAMNSTIFDMYNVSLSRNTFDDHFDNALITLSYEIESLLCLLELEAIRNQPHDINFTAGDQIHGCRIATGSVANRASDVQVADARSCDGEDNILIRKSVWVFRDCRNANLPRVPCLLAHRSRPSWSNGFQFECTPALQWPPALRLALRLV